MDYMLDVECLISVHYDVPNPAAFTYPPFSEACLERPARREETNKIYVNYYIEYKALHFSVTSQTPI